MNQIQVPASEFSSPVTPREKPLKELDRPCLGASDQQAGNPAIAVEACQEPRGGLPLLQVWPSDSPRGEADGQAFVYPEAQESVNDSGIDSIQASPSPTCVGGGGNKGSGTSPARISSPATTPLQSRRPSLLHPDHARLQLHHLHHHHGHQHHHHYQQHHGGGSRGEAGSSSASPDRGSIDEDERQPPSPSSSTTSSLRSVPSSAMISIHSHERRRSSRYSMFDALDLEFALLRANARGSVGPYSLSESLHKLTFTQSLAFPALARGLALKQRPGGQSGARQPRQHPESGMNAFAKIVTALVLVLVSVLVFGVVYKFVRT